MTGTASANDRQSTNPTWNIVKAYNAELLRVFFSLAATAKERFETSPKGWDLF